MRKKYVLSLLIMLLLALSTIVPFVALGEEPYANAIAPMSMTCPGCGRWGSPSTAIISTGSWFFTGNTRTSGAFPNQFIENEQSRHVTRDTTGPCGILLARSNTTETRWVRS